MKLKQIKIVFDPVGRKCAFFVDNEDISHLCSSIELVATATGESVVRVHRMVLDEEGHRLQKTPDGKNLMQTVDEFSLKNPTVLVAEVSQKA